MQLYNCTNAALKYCVHAEQRLEPQVEQLFEGVTYFIDIQ